VGEWVVHNLKKKLSRLRGSGGHGEKDWGYQDFHSWVHIRPKEILVRGGGHYWCGRTRGKRKAGGRETKGKFGSPQREAVDSSEEF